jgi:hypothetical protein
MKPTEAERAAFEHWYAVNGSPGWLGCWMAWQAGAAQQRETDAKLCDEYPLRDPAEYGNAYSAATECAKAIRETS